LSKEEEEEVGRRFVRDRRGRKLVVEESEGIRKFDEKERRRPLDVR